MLTTRKNICQCSKKKKVFLLHGQIFFFGTQKSWFATFLGFGVRVISVQ